MRSERLNTNRKWGIIFLILVGLVLVISLPVGAHHELEASPGEVILPAADEQPTSTPDATEIPAPPRYYYEYEREKNRPPLSMIILLVIVGLAAVVVLAVVFVRQSREE